MTDAAPATPYPVSLEVGYPERLSRWKTLLRLPLLIPVLFFGYLLTNTISLAILATILVRGRIPRWLFDFQLSYLRWGARTLAYASVLTDRYPSFEDGDYPVRLDIRYPERLSRWRLVVWKALTSIAHVFVLIVLATTLLAVIPIGWFAVLIVGRFPSGLHDYVVGTYRWGFRVYAYVWSLTDAFPPFGFDSEAGEGGRDSYVISVVVGVLGALAIVAGIGTLATLSSGEERLVLRYDDVRSGDFAAADTSVVVESIGVSLREIADPAETELLSARRGFHLIEFSIVIANGRDMNLDIEAEDFRLKDGDDSRREPLLVTVEGRPAPIAIGDETLVTVVAVFETPDGAIPEELRYDPPVFIADTVVYEFE